MELAEIAVSLKLSTQLIVCLLPVELRLVSIFGGRSSYAVILIEVIDVGSAFGRNCSNAVFLRSRVSSVLKALHLKQPLWCIFHTGIVAELLTSLLKIFDALLTLSKRLEATRQIVLGNNG